MTGHIKLDRKILSWEWYTDANTFRVFVHLLIMATYKDGRYRGFEIKRGQVVTGRKKLSNSLKLSERSVRTSLEHLISTNEITIQATNRFSIITICKYDYYQSFENKIDQQPDQLNANNRPTTDQQLTTFNKENNIIKKEIERAHPSLEEVERVFRQQGGTTEMAKSFWNKHSATHWMDRGQPIKSWSFLVPNFISIWMQNNRKFTDEKITQQPKIKLA